MRQSCDMRLGDFLGGRKFDIKRFIASFTGRSHDRLYRASKPAREAYITDLKGQQ